MSVYSLASRLNSVQIEVKSKVSKNNPAFTGTVTGITKAMVGLGNVENTSDADKPVSSATATALVKLFNNMGNANGAIILFDATAPSYDYGFRYVNGSNNGPGTSGTAFYSWYIGMGSPYVGTGWYQ